MKKFKKIMALFAIFCLMFTSLPMLIGEVTSNALAKNVTLSTTVASNQAVLRWNKVKTPYSGYSVWKDGQVIKRFNTKTVSFTDTSVSRGVYHTYQIKTYKTNKKTTKYYQYYNKKTKKWQNKKISGAKRRIKKKTTYTYSYKSASNATKIIIKSNTIITSPNSVTLDAGKKVAFSVSANSGVTPSISSSNSNIAFISNGYLYGKAAGKCNIVISSPATGTHNAASKTVPVTVKAVAPAHTHSWSDWQVTTEPTTTSTGVKTRKCSCGATQTQTIPKLTGYTYNIHLINEPYGNGGLTAIYLETNNPTPYTYHIKLKDSNNQEKDINIQTTIDSECNEGFYNDIDLTNLKGKIYICSPNYTGNCKIEAFEFTNEGVKTVASKTTCIRDYNSEETAWMNSVINQVTTPEMSNSEKMWAICEHILQNFTYTTNDGSQYITLITKVGQPYWVQKKTNSAESPAELVKFGNLLNYPLKNMYAEYSDGTPEWYQFHMFARSIEDGTDYWCCPALDTGTIVPSTIQMFDPDTFQFWGE